MSVPALTALLLALTGSGARPASDPALLAFVSEAGVRVEVLAGRALWVEDHGVEQTLTGESRRLGTGRVHLEVPAGSLVRLGWEGIGSLRIEGPAALEWHWEGSRPVWSLHEIGRIDVEVRRGEPRLWLPNGWESRLGEGALRLTTLTSGVPLVEHRAGVLQRLVWRGDARTRPPVDLQAGQRRPLPEPDDGVLAQDPTRWAPAWVEVEWPWKASEAGDTPPAWEPGEARAPWPWRRPTRTVGDPTAAGEHAPRAGAAPEVPLWANSVPIARD